MMTNTTTGKMSRKQALLAITFAAYHGDVSEGARLCIENRVSRSAYNDAWAAGRAAVSRGVACNCFSCKGVR